MSIADKIAVVRETMPPLPMTAANPHFKSKYIPLDKLTEIVMPVLKDEGLTWLTWPSELYGKPTLAYRLADDKETVEGIMPLPLAKEDPQALGSAITYARRYALMTVLGLVGEVDDDGNAAVRPAAPKIPMDRAKSILARASEAGLWADDKPTAVLTAKMTALGQSKISLLTVDQAEELENWLAKEGS